MKDYSDMSAREKVLHQYKGHLCEDLSTTYTEMTLQFIEQGGSISDAKTDMASLGEAFFEIMHKESLQELRRYMIGHHGWDYETFDDDFFRFMSK